MSKKTNHIQSAMRYHKIIFLIVSCLVVLGFYSMTKMNKDEFPQFTIRQGVVAAIYPGASATEIEEQVTKPLEDFLFTYDEIDKEKTHSVSENGIVYIFAELRVTVEDKDEVWSKIRHGLALFKKTSLPAGVLEVVVVDDFGNTSSMLLAVESPDRTPRELETFADQINEQLRTIPAMGNLKILGQQKEEIAVLIDQEKLAAYGISQRSLLVELATQGFRTIGGTIENEAGESMVHLSIPYQSEYEVGEQIIYADPTGNVIRLRDIAKIKRRYAKPKSYVNYDTAEAVIISMEMSPGNNIVAFGKEVEKRIEKVKQTLPPDVQIHKITNQPQVVNDSVLSFLRDLLISIIVIIVVMMLLFPLRTALVASTSVPVCTAITLGFMYLCGIELNTVTLAALIVVLGLIVDDSVIIIDGYVDFLNEGHSRWYSAVTSTKQLFVPMSLATLAISGMFFPMTKIITGPLGDFVQLFPWTITFALVASIFYAVWVIPFLSTQFIKRRLPTQKIGKFEKAQNWFFDFLQNTYNKILEKCFVHPAITILCTVSAVLLGVVLFLNLDVQMLPKADRNCFAVEIHLQEGSTLEQTAAIADSLSQILRQDKRVTGVTSFVGCASPRFHATYAPQMAKKSYAQFIVNTTGEDDTRALLKEYGPKYEHYFPNAYARFKQMDYQAVGNPIEIRLSGGDLDSLKVAADSLKRFLNTIPELTWIHSDLDETSQNIRVVLNTDEATRLGVTQSVLSLYLSSVLGGQELTTVWEGDYKVPVMLYSLQENDDMSYQDLESVMIPTSIPGTWVPLRQVATVVPEYHDATINRRNSVRTVTVGADIKYGFSEPRLMKQIKNYVENDFNTYKPENVLVEYGGLSGANDSVIPQIVLSILAALLVLFAFLLYHFHHIKLVMLNMSASFICIFGATLGLTLFGLDFSITAVLGLVSLIGIIVRNGIIMFEYAETLRIDNHLSAREAAFEAGKRRLRPIFLTSAAAALGVVPMIIAHTSLWMPMGVVICFGTIFSFPFVVTLLPVCYWQLFESNDKKMNLALVKHLKKHIITVMLLCLAMPFASAQSLSLDSCKSLALQNNVAVKNAALDVLAARKVQNQVLTKYFPNISVVAGGYQTLNPLIEFGIEDVKNAEARQMLYNMYAEYGATMGLPNSISLCEKGMTVGATAIQPVFMGGQIVNGSKLAKVGVEAAELQNELTREKLVQQTEEGYWLVVSLQEKKKTLQQAMVFLDTLYRDVSAAKEAGLVTQNDQLKVVLKQNEFKSNMLKVNNGIVLATMALCQVIGVEYSENLQLTDVIEEYPFELEEKDAASAVSRRKESQLLNLNVRAEQLKKKITIGETLPHIMVGAGASYGNLILDRYKFNGLAFATVQVPLTNWWETAYKIQQQKIMIQKAENDRNDLTQKMMLEVQQAWNNLAEAANQIELMKVTVQDAELNAQTSLVNYQAGLVSISELLEAQTLYRQAQDQLVDAQISFKIKWARYQTLVK